ncbi:DNA/RNA polymerase [Phytophthora palmivora]|uniref:DNA/RNA polymerase n=1 Tax=Phytophthora palmivora TaxID=4796 RepID=A0A2P4YEU1_9STRA|nr:DNA/RNA polymerase [Phytophthora palmivora]
MRLPLAKANQELLSYMTDATVYTPTGIPQAMQRYIFKPLWRNVLQHDVDTYLNKLGERFSLMHEFGLKLSAAKTTLFQNSVKWYGNIIDGQGVRHDPLHIEALRKMPLPSTIGELQQLDARQFNRLCRFCDDATKKLDVTLGG